jgi:hypothetical protein
MAWTPPPFADWWWISRPMIGNVELSLNYDGYFKWRMAFAITDSAFY